MDKFLEGQSQILVQQSKEWVEIAVDWETENQYRVMDTQESLVGWISERSGGILDRLKRLFFRSHRPLRVDFFDDEKRPVLYFHREFFFLFSDLFVESADGEKLGSVHRKFGILYKKYDFLDESGQVFVRVRCPIWRLWTFTLIDFNGEKVGEISKKWGGALREVFTDADTFLVDYGSSRTWTPAQRAVIFSAAMSIDFDFFENNSGKKGGVFG